MGSLAWRALGQAALIYLAIGASAVTAQDTHLVAQPLLK
jgi:hypothetical protein